MKRESLRIGQQLKNDLKNETRVRSVNSTKKFSSPERKSRIVTFSEGRQKARAQSQLQDEYSEDKN